MEEGDASVLAGGAVVAEVWVGTRGGRGCEGIGQRISGECRRIEEDSASELVTVALETEVKVGKVEACGVHELSGGAVVVVVVMVGNV